MVSMMHGRFAPRGVALPLSALVFLLTQRPHTARSQSTPPAGWQFTPDAVQKAARELRDQTEVPVTLPSRLPATWIRPRPLAVTPHADTHSWSLVVSREDCQSAECVYAAFTAYRNAPGAPTLACASPAAEVELEHGVRGCIVETGCGESACWPSQVTWEHDGVTHTVSLWMRHTFRTERQTLAQLAGSAIRQSLVATRERQRQSSPQRVVVLRPRTNDG